MGTNQVPRGLLSTTEQLQIRSTDSHPEELENKNPGMILNNEMGNWDFR